MSSCIIWRGCGSGFHSDLPPFGEQEPVLWKTIFPWFGDNSSTLHLLCPLFLFCGDLKILCLDFRGYGSHSYENLMPLLIYQEVELQL